MKGNDVTLIRMRSKKRREVVFCSRSYKKRGLVAAAQEGGKEENVLLEPSARTLEKRIPWPEGEKRDRTLPLSGEELQ